MNCLCHTSRYALSVGDLFFLLDGETHEQESGTVRARARWATARRLVAKAGSVCVCVCVCRYGYSAGCLRLRLTSGHQGLEQSGQAGGRQDLHTPTPIHLFRHDVPYTTAASTRGRVNEPSEMVRVALRCAFDWDIGLLLCLCFRATVFFLLGNFGSPIM
jgi:hypothetical protein